MSNPNPSPATRLKKGYDPRRNLKGVPREAIEMRKMLRKIAAELVRIKDEGGNEVEVTRLYARARLAFSSRNYKEFEMVLKALYPGLLKESLDLTSDGKALNEIVIRYADADRDNDNPAAPA
jgi:hypothetical protein